MVSFFPSRTIAVELFGLSIHWYGIMYVLAFLLALFLLPRLQRWRGLSLSRDDWSSILTAIILGVLLGGRLGYVLFYHPSYYAASPLEVFAVWKGGMSSHGGFLGVGIAVILISRLKRIPLLPLLDLLVVPTAIGLALGRFGNFINQELYGIPTTLPWGIAIPGVEELRHPTQIYAIVKDLSIAVICFAHLRRTVSDSPGGTIVLGLLLYGVLRFLLEYLREQDVASLSIGFLSLTRGQLLTLPLIAVAVGIGLWRRLRVPPGGGS